VAQPAPSAPAVTKPAAQPAPSAPPVTQPAAQPAPAAQSNENTQRTAIVNAAKSYMGAKYVYGAQTPSPPMKFDCSGFIGQAYKDALNVVLPRSSSDLWEKGKKLNKNAVKPGDIIVYSENGKSPSHVSLITDSSNIIHAVSAGSPTGVISQSQTSGSWPNKILGYITYVGVPIAVSRSAKNFVVTDFPLDVSGTFRRITEAIPVQVGSGFNFAVTNNTGSSGEFDVYFYKAGTPKANADNETLTIKNKESAETNKAFFCEEAGQYRLEVSRRSDNKALLEYTFTSDI
jgi:hypothetical protein